LTNSGVGIQHHGLVPSRSPVVNYHSKTCSAVSLNESHDLGSHGNIGQGTLYLLHRAASFGRQRGWERRCASA
jgi:hypothetical protein